MRRHGAIPIRRASRSTSSPGPRQTDGAASEGRPGDSPRPWLGWGPASSPASPPRPSANARLSLQLGVSALPRRPSRCKLHACPRFARSGPRRFAAVDLLLRLPHRCAPHTQFLVCAGPLSCTAALPPPARPPSTCWPACSSLTRRGAPRRPRRVSTRTSSPSRGSWSCGAWRRRRTRCVHVQLLSRAPARTRGCCCRSRRHPRARTLFLCNKRRHTSKAEERQTPLQQIPLPCTFERTPLPSHALPFCLFCCRCGSCSRTRRHAAPTLLLAS